MEVAVCSTLREISPATSLISASCRDSLIRAAITAEAILAIGVTISNWPAMPKVPMRSPSTLMTIL